MKNYRLTALGKIVVIALCLILSLGIINIILSISNNKNIPKESVANAAPTVAAANSDANKTTKTVPADEIKKIEDSVNKATNEKTELNQVLPTIYFVSDSAKLQNQYLPLLDDYAKLMKANKNVTLTIDGYCASNNVRNVDNSAFYRMLSTTRAENVAKYLVSKGISQSRMLLRGHGAENPVGDNSNSETRELNRRVEMKFIIKK